MTPEMHFALTHLPTPAGFVRKLTHVREEVHLQDGYVAVICGPDPDERQRIARALWVLLHREQGTIEP